MNYTQLKKEFEAHEEEQEDIKRNIEYKESLNELGIEVLND